ncbi:ferroxidase fet3 [Coemansia sp. Benny D115]|nr:ferroxidase fet3 [Coemansia sp. Benny D115]
MLYSGVVLGLAYFFLATVPYLAVQATQVSLTWDVGYVYINRDGYNTVRGIGVNGKLPIPPVQVTVGDTLKLTVHNSLNVTTSIHAHGLFQNGTNYLDGPAMITQCGIPPGDTFTYEYTMKQTGTFWLHGHDHHQNSDGLRTPLVVLDKPGTGPYEYDEESLFYFEDWYKETFDERAALTLDPKKDFPPKHGYGFGLINGYNGNDTKPLMFEPNKTYRLRLVNMASTQWFQFTLPGHQMSVIETDGIYTEPHTVGGLDMAPGQRYSVLVKAHNTTDFGYQYNATMYASFIEPENGLSPRVFIGDIQYRQGAPIKDTLSLQDYNDVDWLNDIDLHSLDGEEAMNADKRLKLVVGNNLYSTGQHLDHINNITFALPKVPTLYTALSMGADAMDSRVYGPQTHAQVLQHLEVVELSVHNPNRLPHPMHLHGHVFQIVGYGAADDDPSPPPVPAPTRQSQGAPVKRDTMVVPPHGYIRLRFRADNPGVYLFHCHMDIHFVLGMAMMFIEAPDVLQQTISVPQEMLAMCEKQGVATVGNAAGNEGLDFSGLQPAPVLMSRNMAEI